MLSFSCPLEELGLETDESKTGVAGCRDLVKIRNAIWSVKLFLYLFYFK